MDRGYLDFARLYVLHQAPAFFVIRSKSNTDLHRVYSNPVDKETGVRCDQIVALDGFYSNQSYPDKLRRVKFYDDQRDKRLTFLTNQFTLPAKTIADLYRCRWKVELFFKWIKQHLRIKAFYGTPENAVKTQIWIAVRSMCWWRSFENACNRREPLHNFTGIEFDSFRENALVSSLRAG